jgi:cell division protein FtsB
VTSSRGSGARPRPPRRSRRTQLTSRAAVLALVACALVLALTYPTREFFAQRAQIAELRTQTAEQQARVGRLAEQRARWDDPAFVKAQARQRLHFVMPGETGYVAVGSGGAGKGGTTGGGNGGGDKKPWFSNLADSVKGAGDEPSAGPSPTPAPR